MKQFAFLYAVAGVGLCFLTGCSQTTMRCEDPYPEIKPPENGKVLVMMQVRNDGYYFLGFDSMPFIAGNTRSPNTKDYRFFRHTVYENANRSLMIRRTRSLGGNDLINVKHQRHEYFPWWNLFLFKHKVITSTGVGVQNPQAPEALRGRVFFDD